MATDAGPSLAAVLFTDLVGSSALRASLGEERADELRRVHDRLLTERVEAHGGRVVKGTGDGVVAAFASAFDALGAAVEAQQALDRYGRRRDAIAPLPVRMGMSVGDVSWDGGDCFGTPMVEAARLEAAAEGGQILCSEFVRVMARGRGGHRFRSLGALDLKGLPEPLAACEVEWERPEEPGAEPLPFPPSLVVHSPLAFVGREEELAAAEGHLGPAEGLALLWILGEPGIGKTRLAAELARKAHEAGADVLFGRCDEDLDVPYQPFVAALRHFVDSTAPEHLAERLGRHPAELARLLPDLTGLVPGLEPAPPTDPEVERYRLFEAVGSWLAAATGVRPLVLVLDDLHWATGPTLALLAYLTRAADTGPLRVVGTARTTEPGAEPLQALLDDLADRPVSTTLALQGLGETGVDRLVEAVTGRSTNGTALAHRIHTETAGNPLFVSAMLAGLEPGEDAGELPSDVRSAVRRRTSRLSPPTRELLRVGAVAGLEFDLRVLARVLETGPAAALDAADEAARAHLVEEVGPNRYRFAHALVRAALRQEVGASRAVHTHGRIGEALEALHQDRLDDHADELAHHFGEAAVAGGGPIDKALRYTLRAAELSTAQYASETAARRYRRALELLEGSGRVGDRQHCEVLVALGQAQGDTGDFEEARQTLRRAVGEAEAGGWPELTAEAAVQFEFANTKPGLAGQEAAEMLNRAEQHLGSADSALRARVLTGLARALAHTERADEAGPLLDQAIAMARRVGDDRTLALSLDAVVHTLIGPEQADRRLASARETLEVAGRVGDRRTQNRGAATTATSLLELGRITEVHAAVEEGKRLQQEVADPYAAYLLATLAGVLAFLEGRLDDAERLADVARDTGRDLRGVDPEGMYGVQMFSLRREQGRLAEVAPAIRALVRLGAASPVWRPGLAAVYAELGLTDEARAELEALVSGEDVLLPVDALRAVSLSYLADAATFVGDAERAEVLYRHLEPYGKLCVVMYGIACYGPASRYLGMLAATAGRFDVAQGHFEDALERCHAMGSPLWAAHAQYDFARMLLARRGPGDAAQARLLAGAARTTAAEIGMAALEPRAARLLEG